jgi:dTDP-4-dehydrorhamnose 3,5-epimerase
MRFIETGLAGAFVIEPVLFEDVRGFFTRTFSREEFERHGCNPDLHECNVSFNKAARTLRGMHYQTPPHAQTKLVRCTAGAIWDCVIDLRTGSPTFKKWFGVELTAGNRKQLYIPQGFAHGFITLANDTEVSYQMGNVYHAASARGVRWNDPAFGIRWPREPSVIIERDIRYPDFTGDVAGSL